jgi:hypothetical protein
MPEVPQVPSVAKAIVVSKLALHALFVRVHCLPYPLPGLMGAGGDDDDGDSDTSDFLHLLLGKPKPKPSRGEQDDDSSNSSTSIFLAELLCKPKQSRRERRDRVTSASSNGNFTGTLAPVVVPASSSSSARVSATASVAQSRPPLARRVSAAPVRQSIRRHRSRSRSAGRAVDLIFTSAQGLTTKLSCQDLPIPEQNAIITSGLVLHNETGSSKLG